MEKSFDPKIGQTMLFVRKNKQLKLREMTGGLFTESQLSKFEKGETDITVGKFFKLLEHANIYLDEFQHVYNDYVLAETMEFHQELAQAYRKRDLMTLQKWLFFWKDKAKYEPDLIGNKINEIVVSSVISAVKGSVVFKENITFLMDYLDNVKEWGRFEIWIFGNCLRFFDEEALKYYAGYLLGRTNFYWNMHLNKQLVIGTYLNIIDAFLKKGNLIFAKKYINYLNELEIGPNFFYEKITLTYHRAHYQFLQHKASKQGMINCAKTLEQYGFLIESRILFEEIDKI